MFPNGPVGDTPLCTYTIGLLYCCRVYTYINENVSFGEPNKYCPVEIMTTIVGHVGYHAMSCDHVEYHAMSCDHVGCRVI